MTGRPALLRGGVLVGLLYAVACLVRLPGLALAPGGGTFGSSRADTLGLVWTLWHVAWNLRTHGTLGIRTDLVGFPEGAVLFPADPLEAVLLAPLTLGLGPVVVFNLLQVLHVALAGAATWALARRLGAGPGAALAVTPAVACSPVLLAVAYNGNVDVGQLWLVPLAGLLGWRAGGGGRAWMGAGLAVGVALVANIYVGISAGLAAAALFLAAPGRPRWGRLAALAGLALLVSAPVLLYTGSLVGGVVEKSPATVLQMRLAEGSARLLGLLAPGVRVAADPSGNAGDHLVGQALGWGVLLLALPRLRRPDRLDRALWGLFAAAVVLALGPVLVAGGGPVTVGGRYVPLPFVFLDRLPPFSMLIELWRFTFPAVLALALLGARTLVALPRAAVAGAGLFLAAEALLLTPGPRPWHFEPFPDEPVAALVADLPPGPVLHFPVRQGDRPLLYQAMHGRPVANTPMNMGDPAVFGLVARGTWTLAELRAVARDRGYRWLLLHVRPETATEQPMDAVAADLEAAGLVARRGGLLLLADLEAVGPWPERAYESRNLRRGGRPGDPAAARDRR